jgi:hypothetical protein
MDGGAEALGGDTARRWTAMAASSSAGSRLPSYPLDSTSQSSSMILPLFMMVPELERPVLSGPGHPGEIIIPFRTALC